MLHSSGYVPFINTLVTKSNPIAYSVKQIWKLALKETQNTPDTRVTKAANQ